MVILLSIQCETDKNEDCPALESEKSKPVEPWWGGRGPGAVSYGSRRRDWAHADNAPPSPWPNLWLRVATQGSRREEAGGGNPGGLQPEAA